MSPVLASVSLDQRPARQTRTRADGTPNGWHLITAARTSVFTEEPEELGEQTREQVSKAADAEDTLKESESAGDEQASARLATGGAADNGSAGSKQI